MISFLFCCDLVYLKDFFLIVFIIHLFIFSFNKQIPFLCTLTKKMIVILNRYVFTKISPLIRQYNLSLFIYFIHLITRMLSHISSTLFSSSHLCYILSHLLTYYATSSLTPHRITSSCVFSLLISPQHLSHQSYYIATHITALTSHLISSLIAYHLSPLIPYHLSSLITSLM